MNREPATITDGVRRLFTVMACAAVLLTSFQDEVLLAATVSAASERGEAGALPPDNDPEAVFPDLSRTDNDERFQPSFARTVPSAWFTPQHRRQVGLATDFRPNRLDVSLAALYCVWQI